jgi:arylsulfatase A-like enzyme
LGKDKLVFIVIDALRPDHLGSFGYHRDTSPTLDRLFDEGLLLPRMIVQSTQTVPSTLSIMTSLLPHQHGVHYWASTQSFTGTEEEGAPILGPDLSLMAEHFQHAGYYTAGVVANPWLSADYGFDRGFHTYVEIDRFSEQETYLYDGSMINRQARDLLSTHRDHRLLLYLHYMDVHSPYEGNPRVEPRYRPQHGRYVYDNGPVPDLSPEDLDYTMALYDERIRHLDGLLGELLDWMAREELLEHTTLVITSDHGDEFWEHGGLGHGTTLRRELVRSFCLFWNPDRFAPGRVESLTRAVDILPTLLGAYGLESPVAMEGRDLLADSPAAANPPLIISELADKKAVYWDSWKYVVDANTGTDRLCSIEADGTLRQVTHRTPGDVPASMRLLVERLFEQTRRPRVEALDPRARERLRALGYLD